MKIQLSRKLNKLASTLVTVMVLCSVLGLSVSYYLALIEQQNLLSARSQAWNLAMTVSEAGMEEALQLINSNADHLANDGWTYDGTLYWRTNTLPDGSRYVVNIDYRDRNSPIIVARAYVKPVTQVNVFAAIGVTTTPSTLTRAVKVKASRGSLFLNALVAKNTIDMNGNGVMTDSYDSTDPAKSTNGQYDANRYKGDMGDVASNDGIVNALSIGNADIYGHAHVGPGGTMAKGPGGYISEHVPTQPVVNGVENTWFSADANFTYPETKLH